MEFAWNTQKNKMNDVKGKEMEQDRKGRKSNPDIDDTRTNMNYDLVENDKTLYQRVKESGLMSIFWTQKVKLFYAALLANNSH